mgnify:FL=1
MSVVEGPAKNTYRKLLDDIAGIYDGALRESIMEPHGLKPGVPGLPRLALRNRTAISRVKSREFLFEKFLGIRCDEIFFDNFATLVGVIRRHVASADNRNGGR